MTRTRLAPLALLLLLPAFAASAARAASLPADSTAILSGQPSLFSQLPAPHHDSFARGDSVSKTGRFVAFSSSSDGLSSEDDDDVFNVYVKDRASGAVTFVSRRTGVNGAAATRDCSDATISDDGSRVAFTCSGALDPADTNSTSDVYLRDLAHGTTALVSRASGPDGAVGDRFSNSPALNTDGTRVAFQSNATNLSGTSHAGVYVRDVPLAGQLSAQATTLVSVADNEGLPNDDSGQPSITNDGNKVAFSSRASNLVTGDNNGVNDAFVRNIGAGTTELESRQGATIGNGDSGSPAISGDGSVVVFDSAATNLDPRDTTNGFDVYRHSGTSSELVDRVGDQKASIGAFEPDVNDDGSVVMFKSSSTDLVPGLPASFDEGFFVVKGGAVELASRADGANGAPARSVFTGAVSGDGKQLLFEDFVGSVLPGEESATFETIAMRDLDAHTTRAVAVPPGGGAFTNQGDFSAESSLSSDGRYSAFVTAAPGLGTPPDGSEAVVVRDAVTGAVELASRETGPAGKPMSGRMFDPTISANGRRVAFTLELDNKFEVWLRDLDTGASVRVDVKPDGTPANGGAAHPSIDAAGLRVAFLSQATNLDPADTSTGTDAYVRDLASNETFLVSRGVTGARGNGEVRLARLSGKGDHVAFATSASNLGDGDTDTFDDVHVRDIAAGTTRLVSVSTDGHKSTDNSGEPSISADGTRVAFSSFAKNLGSGSSAPNFDGEQIWVRDLAAHTTTLASRFDGSGGDAGDGDSSTPAISSNGQVVAFGSLATNLVPGVPLETTEVYRRDLAASTTRLVSRAPGANGMPETGDASLDAVTADGACVSFTADGNAFEASALGRTDFEQVYLRVFVPDCGRPPGSAGRDTTPPVLRSVSLSRTRFRVAKAATRIAARHKRLPRRGTTLRFTSSEAATLKIAIQRTLPGRKVRKGHKRICRPVHRRVKHGRCTAFRKTATLTRQIKAGRGRVALGGRIGRRRMAPGRYRLTLTARDAAGNLSKAARRSFTIVRG